jgi:hypothetical protein
MGRGDYITTEKGDEYFENGKDISGGKHELAMDWLKKSLVCFPISEE